MRNDNVIARWHPNNILSVLDEIDNQTPSYTLNKKQTLRRVVIVLACVSISLLIGHYAKFSSNFNTLLVQIAEWKDLPSEFYYTELNRSGLYELCTYAWWTLVHAVTYVLLPALTIWFFFKQSVRDFGWKLNETTDHWKGYILLLSPILVFVYLVSLGKDFVVHYPFYSLASRSWVDFLAWEFLYLTQFICLEFFFRGFMLNALRPALGANAIWIMCVPYLMIHFPKLWLEATGAILFGLFLGILALRSRSIWGGVMVHAGVALSMDVMALIRKQGLPESWWPL